MEQERNETYERIPWETLERQAPDRQRVVIGAAAVVVVAALAYSFMRNQPVTPADAGGTSTTSVAATEPPPAQTSVPMAPAPPVVVAEADLYAVDPERLYEEAAARAEWFAVEYLSYDGSASPVLTAMLPEGVPAPTAPDGVQVYVDWAGVLSVAEEGPGRFQAQVVVRSLRSSDGGAFARQDDLLVTVSLALGEEGEMRITRPPMVEPAGPGEPLPLETGQLPQEVAEAAEEEYGEVIGGISGEDGRWQLYVMTAGIDGVTRPQTVLFP